MACRACAEKKEAPSMAGHGRGRAAGLPARAPAPCDGCAPAGTPLAAPVRARFERQLGADLGAVRLHDHPAAHARADALGAAAYTHGSDIGFSAGAWRPGTPAGDRLLAHELAHVVQQGAGAGRPGAPAVQRKGGAPGDAFEREADRVADTLVAGGAAAPVLRTAPTVQRQPRTSLLGEDWQLRAPTIAPPPLFWPGEIREAIVLPELPALPELHFDFPDVGWRRPPLWDTPSLTLDPALRFTPVRIIPIPRRDPDRLLTWADFPRNSVPGGFAALTSMRIRRLTPDGNPMFQAQMLATSAVRPRSRNATDRAQNGCAPLVARCQRDMRASPGGTWTTSRPVPDTCPASVIGIRTASTVDECETVVGAGCDTDAAAESARLLAHEQGHFDIGWRLVIKANDALIAGTHTDTELNTWLNATLGPQQELYDEQTNHGCNATAQATWVTALAAGLPAVPLPAPAPARP